MRLSFRILLALAAAALPGLACKSSVATVGEFKALTSNLSDGDIWALNRPIVVVFNNEVDPDSITFSAFVLRSTDAGNPNPVTGFFELGPDSDGRPNRAIIFRPVCPTNVTNDNGSFRPGGFQYQLSLPTQASSTTVLRDLSGNNLAVGLTRSFQTPTPPSEPLFADTVNGPMSIVDITWPQTLNLFTQDRLFVRVRFNQSFDASPGSLNLTNLFVQYANSGGTFPISGNVVPGRWIVLTNCSDEAEVLFEITGVLIPSRGLRVVMDTGFLDLGGTQNSAIITSDAFLAPSLVDLTSLPTFDEDDVFVDEFQDSFLSSVYLDAGADLPQPPAAFEPDGIRAVFTFGGTLLPTEDDFVVTSAQAYLEIDTTGVTQVTDGLGRTFACNNGVMQVSDFTIEPGATLRLRGANPFILYASGAVNFFGTLDASGFNAQVPDGGHFHPELAVPGALGVLGGGRGGTSSQVIDDFTPRGESGQGPFGTGTGLGGQGGEGAIQQSNNVALSAIEFMLAGGGGGGGFSAGRTDAIFWNKWAGTQVPVDFDNVGPDLRSDKHTVFNGTVNANTLFTGAGAGERGTNKAGIILPNPSLAANAPHAAYGMEDIQQDSDAGTDATWDPAWTTGATPPYLFGNPTFGPDGGAGGASIFSDTDPSNNFYGNRFFWDGTPGVAPVLVEGELMTPWAGAGGGASGDVQTVERFDLVPQPPDGFLEPLPTFFPDTLFPFGTTRGYWRGAPGGGGGGQVQIHAVGVIKFGAAGRVKAIGGTGNSGESTDESASQATITQISGSGGGSGGHIILQSATGLDLALIGVGTAGNPNVPGTFFNNLVPADIVQALGGRRGWAGAKLNTGLTGSPGTRDGNSTYMAGRGGAGASGLIQIHIPDPATDITFAPNVDAAFKAYMTAVNPLNPVVSDRLDALLGLYGEPQPFGLVPFFSPQTMAQSIWIDTGLASERAPANGTGPFPDFAHVAGGFSGVAGATGFADQNGDRLADGAVVASDGGSGTASFTAYEMVVNAASGSFATLHLSNPALLIGFDVVPNTAQLPLPKAFEIVAAAYDSASDRMTLSTRVIDGPLTALASLNWAVRAKYFRVNTSGVKDRLPANSKVRFQFQGASALAGTNTLDPASITPWTGDGVTTLTTLKGKRFIRWRLTFDLDSGATGAVLEAEIPVLDYLKLPFAW